MKYSNTFNKYISFKDVDLNDLLIKQITIDTRDFACYLQDKLIEFDNTIKVPTSEKFIFSKSEIIYLINKWRNHSIEKNIVVFDLLEYPRNFWHFKYVSFYQIKTDEWLIKTREGNFLKREILDFTPINKYEKYELLEKKEIPTLNNLTKETSFLDPEKVKKEFGEFNEDSWYSTPQGVSLMSHPPYKKEKTQSNNELCNCNSGKKFKKCCK